jgi:hypothetical protein
MSLENIIKSLENGLLPVELDYRNHGEEGKTIDWDKVLYNVRYHTPEYYASKFPPECKHIPAFDKIIDLIVEKNYNNSPLKEILERQDEMIERQNENILNNKYNDGEEISDQSRD